MIRTVATEIALFLTPFALYALFLWLTKSGVLDRQSWPARHIISLAIAALLLVVGSFLYFAHYDGAAPGARYVPAHVDEQGRFVPGAMR